MSDEDEVIPVSHITGWTVVPLVGHEIILMQFHVLSSELQPKVEPVERNLFAITPDMAQALITQLQDHNDSFKSTSSFKPDGPIH